MEFYNYKGKVNRVIDGDTLLVTFQMGLDLELKNQLIRLKGINAPEMIGDNRQDGIASKNYLNSLVLDKEINIKTFKSRTKDKYGRYLAEIWLLDKEKSVNQMMIDGGFAIKYEG